MYSQFLELAGVDITREPMDVGPTCHYMMGGVRVDADTAATTVPGLFAAGEVAGGMHGANRLGGNSLSDLIVFGRRAGIGAADYAEGLTGTVEPEVSQATEAASEALSPFSREGGESPYRIHADLQECMQTLVGIIRTETELIQALDEISKLKDRASKVSVQGGREYNPAWNLATDLPSMLAVSEMVARGALDRKESRGGHTRDDYPSPDPEFAKVNLVQRLQDGKHTVQPEPLPEMPDELKALFEDDHAGQAPKEDH